MKDKVLLTDQIEMTIRCRRGQMIRMTISADSGWSETDNIRVELQTDGEESSFLGTLGLSIHTNTLEESCLLEKDRPVRITMYLAERPEKITAFYMYNPWWTRPAFPSSCAELPDRTQIALLQFRDRIVCLVPMVGDRFKTVLCPGENAESLNMEMTALVGGVDKRDSSSAEPTGPGNVSLPWLVQLGRFPDRYFCRGRPRKGCRTCGKASACTPDAD